MDLDEAYANAPLIPDAEGYPPRWEAASEALRARLGQRARLDLPYGEGPRQVVDLFLPEGTPRGLMVFIHGGYWKTFTAKTWSLMAEGALARGWAVALPTYTLAPQARISQITQEIARAIPVAAAEVAGPIVICGHSAGGHLTARMITAGVLPAEVAARVERALPISPVADLRPLMETKMQEAFRLTPEEAEAESPVLNRDWLPVTARVLVGGAERPVFLRDARDLAALLGGDLLAPEGEHHFNVVDVLRDPQSPLMAWFCP